MRPKTPYETKVLSVRLPVSLYEKLKERAKFKSITMNSLVIAYLEAATCLDQNKEDTTPEKDNT